MKVLLKNREITAERLRKLLRCGDGSCCIGVTLHVKFVRRRWS